jgi:hypothetical protein
VTDESRPDGDWAARLQFRQLPDDATKLDRQIDELNATQLPGPGSVPILDELHAQLIELDPDYVLVQVKEKFGTLRVYTEVDPAVRDRALELVAAAERRSAATCEDCGDPGTLRENGRWDLTLCEVCDVWHEDGRPLPNEWLNL